MSQLPSFALSIWAPWAFAILHLGKTIENRTLRGAKRNGFPRHFFGEFWLHSSLWPGSGRRPLNAAQQHELKDEFRSAFARSGHSKESFRTVTLDEIDGMRGKIVGRVTVTDYVEQSESPWFVPGSLGLVLTNPVALAAPVEASGALGWWRVPQDKLDQLREGS
jgi:hypothetical protein